MISLAASLTSALFAATWQGLLLAAAVALCLRLVPALTAAARSLIWLAVFALAILLHFTQVPASSIPATASARYLYIDRRWSLLIAALWAVGSLVRAVQLAAGTLELSRLARTATPISIPPASSALCAAPRPIELCTSPDIDRPSVLGFFHPRILLPVGLLETLAPSELHQILLHEVEHLRRRDDWTNLFQKLALVAFPLNPVLLWLERRLAHERELACDDRVLEATGARKAYASCLAHLAEHILLRRGLSLALGAWHHQSELARRITRILTRPSDTLNPRIRTALVTLLLTLTTGGSIELAHSPQFLRFTSPTARLTASTGTQAPNELLPVTYHPRTTVMPFVSTKAVLTSRPKNHPDPQTRLTIVHSEAHNIRVHLALTLASPNQFTYAAVPVDGGWIVVPLQTTRLTPLTLEL